MSVHRSSKPHSCCSLRLTRNSMFPLWFRYMPAKNADTTLSTGSNTHTTELSNLICVKRFHKHNNRQTALLNRNHRAATTVSSANHFTQRRSVSTLISLRYTCVRNLLSCLFFISWVFWSEIIVGFDYIGVFVIHEMFLDSMF